MRIHVAAYPAVLCLLINGLPAQGLKKHTQSTIEFGFGTYAVEEIIKIQDQAKRTDTNAKFKGKGLTGKIAGKFFGKQGNRGEIIDLGEGNIYSLDLNKKKCEVRPIVNVADTVQSALENLKQLGEGQRADAAGPEDDRVEILESVFRVTDEGKSLNRNGFDCREYRLTAYTRWRDRKTNQTGTDSLSVLTWMTPETADLRRAMEIERDFTLAYLTQLGFEQPVGGVKDALLGSKWLDIFKQVETEEAPAERRYANRADEMAKLEGQYPIAVDGAYFARREARQQQAEAEADPDADASMETRARKGLGGLAKGLFGKKKKKEDPNRAKRLLRFQTETLMIAVANIPDEELSSPFTCKQK